MLPEVAPVQGDQPCRPNDLQPVIKLALSDVKHHADQMERVRRLEAQAEVNKKAEDKAGAELFCLPSSFPPEWFKEPGSRGYYLSHYQMPSLLTRGAWTAMQRAEH